MQAPENYSYGLAHKKQKDRYVAQVVRPLVWHLLCGVCRCRLLACSVVEHCGALHVSSSCAPTFPDGCLPACDARSLRQQHIQPVSCTPLCSALLPLQVTPASPHLLHGLVDEETDLLFDAAPPLLALVPQASRATPRAARLLPCVHVHACVCKLVFLHTCVRCTQAVAPLPGTTFASPVARPAPCFDRWAATRCWR